MCPTVAAGEVRGSVRGDCTQGPAGHPAADPSGDHRVRVRRPGTGSPEGRQAAQARAAKRRVTRGRQWARPKRALPASNAHAACSWTRPQIRGTPSWNGRAIVGGLLLTAVMISAATVRSLTLRFCEAERRTAKAASASHRFCPMMIPIVWSITVRDQGGSQLVGDLDAVGHPHGQVQGARRLVGEACRLGLLFRTEGVRTAGVEVERADGMASAVERQRQR